MTVERRERAIAIWLGSTGDGRNPMFNGRRQPSRGGTSRMTRECQVRFCEGLGVKLPGPTRQEQTKALRGRRVRIDFKRRHRRPVRQVRPVPDELLLFMMDVRSRT